MLWTRVSPGDPLRQAAEEDGDAVPPRGLGHAPRPRARRGPARPGSARPRCGGRRSSPAGRRATPRARPPRRPATPRRRGCCSTSAVDVICAAATTSRAVMPRGGASRARCAAGASRRRPGARRGATASSPAASRPWRRPARSASGRGRTPGSAPQAGRRAMQIFRPWKIRRSVVRVQRSRGMIFMSWRSISSGIVAPGDAEPLGDAEDVGVDGDALRDVVGVAEHDAGRLPPHARAGSPSRPWSAAPRRRAARRARARTRCRLFALDRKKPVERMISSSSSGFARAIDRASG